jgi:hypothetical protein
MEQHMFSEICIVDENKINDVEDMEREIKKYLKANNWISELHIINIITSKYLGIGRKSMSKRCQDCDEEDEPISFEDRPRISPEDYRRDFPVVAEENIKAILEIDEKSKELFVQRIRDTRSKSHLHQTGFIPFYEDHGLSARINMAEKLFLEKFMEESHSENCRIVFDKDENELRLLSHSKTAGSREFGVEKITTEIQKIDEFLLSHKLPPSIHNKFVSCYKDDAYFDYIAAAYPKLCLEELTETDGDGGEIERPDISICIEANNIILGVRNGEFYILPLYEEFALPK